MLINFEKTKKNIFFYLSGKYHFDMFYNIFALNKDIEFFIYSKNISKDDFLRSKLVKLENVIFTKDIENILYKALSFGCFISTELQAARPHDYSLKIASLFKLLNIPVVEIQHGLFQLGYSYQSLPVRDRFYSDSIAIEGFSDYSLLYYNMETSKKYQVIGFPEYIKKSTKTIIKKKDTYTLILSNMHWDAYDIEEKYRFYYSVIKFVENSSDKLFIWKLHYGETFANNKKIINEIMGMFPKAKEKILFANDNDMLKNISVSELIVKSKSIISTVSTVLLNCEMYKRPTYIYESKSVKCLIDKIEKKTTFKNLDELKEVFEKDDKANLNSGLLIEYDNNKFIDFINDVYKEQEQKQDTLQNILETIEYIKNLK